jgi:hypothetical protein
VKNLFWAHVLAAGLLRESIVILWTFFFFFSSSPAFFRRRTALLFTKRLTRSRSPLRRFECVKFNECHKFKIFFPSSPFVERTLFVGELLNERVILDASINSLSWIFGYGHAKPAFASRTHFEFPVRAKTSRFLLQHDWPRFLGKKTSRNLGLGKARRATFVYSLAKLSLLIDAAEQKQSNPSEQARA